MLNTRLAALLPMTLKFVTHNKKHNHHVNVDLRLATLLGCHESLLSYHGRAIIIQLLLHSEQLIQRPLYLIGNSLASNV